MDNRQDEETERRWKDADASEERLQSTMHVWSEHIKDQKKRLEAEMARIDKERADDTDDVVEVVEEARDRAPKRRRTTGR